MKMNFNALKNHLINSQAQGRIELSFSQIEEICGTISITYIENRDFDRRYAFHRHLEEAGYRISHPVDYENRVMWLERITEDDSVSAESVVLENEQHISLSDRITESYEELFSARIRINAQQHHISEDEILWYVVYTCATMASLSYERQQRGEAWRNREEIARLTIEKIRSLREGVDFDEWLLSICRSDTSFGMRFGLWQKMINVSLKEMYLFYVECGYFTQYAWLWEGGFCHCPVDRIIRDILVGHIRQHNLPIDIAPLRTIVWNYIDEDQYIFFQNAVEQLCLREGLSSKMYYDVMYWRRPN